MLRRWPRPFWKTLENFCMVHENLSFLNDRTFLRTVKVLATFTFKQGFRQVFLKMENINALNFLSFKNMGKDSPRLRADFLF